MEARGYRPERKSSRGSLAPHDAEEMSFRDKLQVAMQQVESATWIWKTHLKWSTARPHRRFSKNERWEMAEEPQGKLLSEQ